MTKKHYEAIATILKETAPLESWLNKYQQYYKTCTRLADYFETDNRNFDRTRFLQACGIVTDYPCEQCHGIRDVEARICSNCRP